MICLHTVKWLNSFIWTIEGTLTDTTTPGQSGPGSNNNKQLLNSPHGSSPPDVLVL